MRFIETGVEGAYVIEPHKIEDERGFFARAWCEHEFGESGLCTTIRQSNMASNRRRGTLRGLHYQRPPFQEVKVVRCFKGALFDVVVDLRPDSPTYLEWHGVELNDENHLALYVPEGCATGYLTLADGAAMEYYTSQVYVPESATGIRFDDPLVGIVWPMRPVVISSQDQAWPEVCR